MSDKTASTDASKPATEIALDFLESSQLKNYSSQRLVNGKGDILKSLADGEELFKDGSFTKRFANHILSSSDDSGAGA